MWTIFDIFDEYEYEYQFTLFGDRDWNWFKIYIFTKKEIDLATELETLNLLLVKHRLEGYGEFRVCIEHLLLPDGSFTFMSKKVKIKKQNGHWI